MLMLLLAIISIITLPILLIKLLPFSDVLNNIVYPVLILLGFTALVAYMLLIGNYTKAGYEAAIINKRCDTEYTQDQLFFARTTILELVVTECIDGN